MKFPISTIFVIAISCTAAFGQKGVDSQTQKIKDESNRVTSRSNDATRSFDWGKGKTKVRDRLPNPYRLNARRDVLIGTIVDALREMKIAVDEGSSRPSDGTIITQPFMFAKGAVITQNEINRYAILDTNDTAWTRGQFTLTITVQSIDGIQNNVSVNAKVEGKAMNGLQSEWITIQSSGVAEDEFLAKLVELVTGNSVEPKQDTDHT